MFKLTACLWTHKNQIKRVEGFPQTLCIRITLKDDSHYERYISEERINDYADPNGKWQRQLRENYDRSFGSWLSTPENIKKQRDKYPYIPPLPMNREAAMDYEVSLLIREIVDSQ